MSQIDSIVSICIGLSATLIGHEVFCFGLKPDVFDTQRYEKWKKVQKFFRWGGPVLLLIGLVGWLFPH